MSNPGNFPSVSNYAAIARRTAERHLRRESRLRRRKSQKSQKRPTTRTNDILEHTTPLAWVIFLGFCWVGCFGWKWNVLLNTKALLLGAAAIDRQIN